MILWIGDYCGTIAVRTLGANGVASRCIRTLKPYNNVPKVLRHREGTTRLNGTSPSIGSDKARKCRDYSLMGFNVGSYTNGSTEPPTELGPNNCCVMAYDIESVFAGPERTSFESAILCISLKCTCGFEHIVTRHRIIGLDCEQTVRDSNEGISVETMKIIIHHLPVFVVGHNVYSFDNPLLAKSLPKHHHFRTYFESVQKSDGKSSTTLGLIITIPGVNNLDTYKYIFHSMYDRFKHFSLEYLCKTLQLPVGKMDNNDVTFCKDWYSECFTNTSTMAKYNMRDCEATLGLCQKLDIVNQVVTLCYGSKAWIRDVLLNNTGAMSLSSMCSLAWSKDCRYNWTRCDWLPKMFIGGHVLFTGEKVRNNVAIVDFTSMYPSIIKDGGISPECIDFIDLSDRHRPRFDYIEVIYTHKYSTSSNESSVGVVAMGINGPENTDAIGVVLVAECCDMMKSSYGGAEKVAFQRVVDFCNEIRQLDTTLQSLDFRTFCNVDYNIPKTDSVFEWYLEYSNKLCNQCHLYSKKYSYVYSPNKELYSDGIVDWEVGPIYNTMKFTTKEYIARFPPGPRVCSEACQNLMDLRKKYKGLMKLEPNKGLKNQYDRLQYSLKICANSMYGAMSFQHYNSYSPRCGTSVTGSGRWALNVASSIIKGLGFEVIYGDTDSVMYTLEPCSESRSLVNNYVDHINEVHVDTEPTNIMEFVSGNNNVIATNNLHLLAVCNIVVKVVNNVMSYTCFRDLRIEQQETSCTTPKGCKSVIFPSFIVSSKKHYVGILRNGELYTKGMNYIRRSGSTLSSATTLEFITIVLNGTNINAIKLALSRSCQEYRWKITRGEYKHLLGIKMKYRGLASNYIKTIPSSTNPNNYVDFDSVNNLSIVDMKHYAAIIQTSLKIVTVPLGVNSDSIYSGHSIERLMAQS